MTVMSLISLCFLVSFSLAGNIPFLLGQPVNSGFRYFSHLCDAATNEFSLY